MSCRYGYSNFPSNTARVTTVPTRVSRPVHVPLPSTLSAATVRSPSDSSRGAARDAPRTIVPTLNLNLASSHALSSSNLMLPVLSSSPRSQTPVAAARSSIATAPVRTNSSPSHLTACTAILVPTLSTVSPVSTPPVPRFLLAGPSRSSSPRRRSQSPLVASSPSLSNPPKRNNSVSRVPIVTPSPTMPAASPTSSSTRITHVGSPLSMPAASPASSSTCSINLSSPLSCVPTTSLRPSLPLPYTPPSVPSPLASKIASECTPASPRLATGSKQTPPVMMSNIIYGSLPVGSRAPASLSGASAVSGTMRSAPQSTQADVSQQEEDIAVNICLGRLDLSMEQETGDITKETRGVANRDALVPSPKTLRTPTFDIDLSSAQGLEHSSSGQGTSGSEVQYSLAGNSGSEVQDSSFPVAEEAGNACGDDENDDEKLADRYSVKEYLLDKYAHQRDDQAATAGYDDVGTVPTSGSTTPTVAECAAESVPAVGQSLAASIGMGLRGNHDSVAASVDTVVDESSADQHPGAQDWYEKVNIIREKVDHAIEELEAKQEDAAGRLTPIEKRFEDEHNAGQAELHSSRKDGSAVSGAEQWRPEWITERLTAIERDLAYAACHLESTDGLTCDAWATPQDLANSATFTQGIDGLTRDLSATTQASSVTSPADGGITWVYDEAGKRCSEEQDSRRKIFCSGETVQHNEASDLGARKDKLDSTMRDLDISLEEEESSVESSDGSAHPAAALVERQRAKTASQASTDMCDSSRADVADRTPSCVDAVESPRRLASPRDSEKQAVVCPNGHPLIALGSATGAGWACDGRHLLGGCKSGITDYHQTRGMDRFRCEPCDYDLCHKCYATHASLTEAGKDSTFWRFFGRTLLCFLDDATDDSSRRKGRLDKAAQQLDPTADLAIAGQADAMGA